MQEDINKKQQAGTQARQTAQPDQPVKEEPTKHEYIDFEEVK
jgi:hypothetical protein